MYSRKITVGAITDLLRLYRHSMQSYALNLEGSGYHHYSDFIQTLHIHGDFAKLVCIGLVERGSNHDPAKKDSGMYKITAKGVAFVCDGGTVPERLFLYHNELTGVSLETKRVTDFYPQFNYEQLMAEGVI